VGNVQEELTGDLNHHFRQLLILAREKHGLIALSDTARLEQLKVINLEDIKRFYKKTHRSDNLRFVLAGKIGGRLKEIDELFSDMTLGRGKRIDMPAETPKKLKEVHYIERPGLQNIYFLWHSFATRELTGPENDAMRLVNVMLTETLHSRILGTARENGLAYDLMSHINIFDNLTDWWFGAEIRAENVLKVFDITTKELKRILAGKIDKADIEAAKQYVIGRHQRNVQTPRSLMRLYSSEYFFNGQIRDNNQFEERINNVTSEMMVDVVKTMFKENKWGLSVLGTDQQILAEKMQNNLSVLWK
jgi:predicted Zn-dependent peptidase